MVEGSGTIYFYWKVSLEQNADYLKLYLDGVYKDQISGEVDWQSPRDPLRDTSPTASPPGQISWRLPAGRTARRWTLS